MVHFIRYGNSLADLTTLSLLDLSIHAHRKTVTSISTLLGSTHHFISSSKYVCVGLPQLGEYEKDKCMIG